MKYFISLVLALIIVLLTVSLVSKGVMPEGTAVATGVEGTAIVFTSEAPAGRPIRKNDSIATNDRVEVQGNSRLELRLPDGGWLRLTENTTLAVRMLQFEKKTGFMYLQASLPKGRVWINVNRRGTPESRVDVLTSTGLAVGKSAVFGVDAEEKTGATLSVYGGAVRVVTAAANEPQPAGQADESAEVPSVSIQALQQLSLSTPEVPVQPRTFELKSALNDWIRWNLQRDAREGLASITIAPASPTITMGSSLQFSAAAHYADNIEKDITSFATWTSANASVAKIDHFGTAAGKQAGAAVIAAVIEDMNGSTVLNVSREIVSVKVTPAARSIVNGAVQQLTAMGTFSDRTVKDITSSAVWRSSNSNVAFVDAGGRVVAGNTSGTAVITASLGSRRGSATLKVRRELVSIAVLPESAIVIPGDTQRFGAIGNYSDKTSKDITELVEWESSDLGIAVIEQVQPGRVLGQSAGTATVTATFKGISGSATVTVEKMPSR